MSSFSSKVNIVFWVSVSVVLFCVLLGVFFPSALAEGAEMAYQFTTTNFGWFYLISVAAIVFFCIYMAIGKFGKIRLGGIGINHSIPVSLGLLCCSQAGLV